MRFESGLLRQAELVQTVLFAVNGPVKMSDVLSATLAAWARGLCDGTASPLELLAGAVACYAALVGGML